MTKALNFEELSVIKLRVQFTDSWGVLVELKELDINVVDVNETPTDLHVTFYEIHKKSLVGDLVGNITVSLLRQGMISYKTQGGYKLPWFLKRKPYNLWYDIFLQNSLFPLLVLFVGFSFLFQCQN